MADGQKKDDNIVYVKHPLSKAEKEKLRAEGKIIRDEKFAPDYKPKIAKTVPMGAAPAAPAK